MGVMQAILAVACCNQTSAFPVATGDCRAAHHLQSLQKLLAYVWLRATRPIRAWNMLGAEDAGGFRCAI